MSKWVKILSAILETALKDLDLQLAGIPAARDAKGLARSFGHSTQSGQVQDKIQTLNLDVTERPIGRGTDHQTQCHDYSGKQNSIPSRTLYSLMSTVISISWVILGAGLFMTKKWQISNCPISR